MILVDANLLVYAYVETFPQQKQARTWLDGRLNDNALLGPSWARILAFMRLVTIVCIFEHPATVEKAWNQER